MEMERRVLRVEYRVDLPIVSYSEWARSYVEFIDFLRQRLSEFFPGPPPPSPDKLITLLPPLSPPAEHIVEVTHYLELVLITRRIRAKLRIDPYHSPRVYGFFQEISSPHTTERWLVFGTEDTTNPDRLIHGSSLLGFNGDYDSLQKVAQDTGERIGMGPEQLASAIKTLATSIYTSHMAVALIVVTRMITDAITDPSIPDSLVDSLSGGYPRPQKKPAPLRKCYKQVRAYAGKFSFTNPADDGHPRPLAGPGDPLAEVCSVVINDVTGGADLYGEISAEDGIGCLYIYNTGKEDSVPIPAAADTATPSSSLLLTGPSRSISGCDYITIRLDLKDRNRDDEVIISSSVAWSSIRGPFNTLLVEELCCNYGSATVNYVVLSQAVQATLEVTLLRNNRGDGDNRAPAANIHGYIHAGSNCGGDDTSYFSVLFLKGKEEKKKNDNDIVVPSGQLIPLSRSVVSVKLSCSLKVEAELFTPSIHLSSQEHDDEIANGTVEFCPKLSGTSEGSICGKYGEIRVKVTWGSVKW